MCLYTAFGKLPLFSCFPIIFSSIEMNGALEWKSSSSVILTQIDSSGGHKDIHEIIYDIHSFLSWFSSIDFSPIGSHAFLAPFRWMEFGNQSLPVWSPFIREPPNLRWHPRTLPPKYTWNNLSHTFSFLFIRPYFSRWSPCIFGPIQMNGVLKSVTSCLVTLHLRATKRHFYTLDTFIQHTYPSVMSHPYFYFFFALKSNHTHIF